MNQQQADVWGLHASQWRLVGSPLKPSFEDTALTLSALRELWTGESEPCRMALLGVTQELVQLPWPRTVSLEAFDHSAEMIAKVWQPNRMIHSRVHLAEWQSLPLCSGSLQAVIGDACLNALPDFKYVGNVLREVHRVLTTEGRMITRCFIRPEETESVEEVVAAAMAGRVGSFHVMKWRLAMSLADTISGAVAVRDIHKAFETSVPSRLALSEATDWPEEQINTIDVYRGSPTQYIFPTLSQLLDQCRPWFDVVRVAHGTYELADRCPTLTLLRKRLG